MSVCDHDIYCPGVGPKHDAATLGPEGISNLLREARPLLRSGNPQKRAVGASLRARMLAAKKALPKKPEYGL